MRVIIRILALLALLLASLVPVGTATAAPANSERFDTFVFDVNLCNRDEFVVGDGTVHFVLREQKDGSFVANFNVHAQGVDDQGNQYVLNINGKEKFSNKAFSFTARASLISKGAGVNQVVNISYNWRGNSNFEVDCRGRIAS